MVFHHFGQLGVGNESGSDGIFALGRVRAHVTLHGRRRQNLER